ncbi:DUF6477 family protein [Pararhodobacter sp.]|uniref:DUF6477 family protein n=1 Tax=Pararhodobacter sp. TaxID=2127056 RepID=UPI002AFDFB2D|nr:DUF6477 family protein [Pararhodobacter sp.]
MSCQDRESIVTVLQTLARIKRPQLLLRTARHGTRDYNRNTDLRRILRVPATPPPGVATVRALIELEAWQNEMRTRPPHEIGTPWRAARHVEVLIALIAEAGIMAEVVQPVA